MDSILATNAPSQFKPKLFAPYWLARVTAWLTGVIGWAGIFVALAALGLRAGISALPDYANLVSWIEPLWAGGGILAGLVLVNLAALTRASLDSADYGRQLLQLQATRGVRPPVRPRNIGKDLGGESDLLRATRNEPLADIVEPRIN